MKSVVVPLVGMPEVLADAMPHGWAVAIAAALLAFGVGALWRLDRR